MPIQPFDFDADTAVVKTGSFTIPAGEYAIIVAQVRNGGTFTIDAVVALNSSAVPTAATVVAQSISTVASYTVPANHIFEGQVSATDAGAVQIDIDGVAVFINTGTGQINEQIKAGPGAVIDLGTGTGTLTGYSRDVIGQSSSDTGVFQAVPTGTVLNGTGEFRYTVITYTSVS